MCIIRIKPVYNDCHFGWAYGEMVALSWTLHTQDHYGYRAFTIYGTTETWVVHGHNEEVATFTVIWH